LGLLATCNCIVEHTGPIRLVPLEELSLWDFINYTFGILIRHLDLDPEAYMTTADLIEYNDYPVELHYVVTHDGYILEVTRFGGKNRYDSKEYPEPRTPVVLFPEIVFPNSHYVLNTRSESLGFILQDEGYDVWLGTWRGMQYSRRHMTLHPDSWAFWDFTLDDLGTDFADIVKYIHKKTGQKVVTMGEGYGGLSCLMGLHNYPEINEMTLLNVGLSPAATMNGSFSFNPNELFRTEMKPTIDLLEPYFRKFGISRIGAKDTVVFRFFLSMIAKALPHIATRTAAASFNKFGMGAFNVSRITVISNHIPTELPVMLMKHIVEGIYTGEINQYDWGKEENMRRRGYPEARKYDFKKITSRYLSLRAFNDMVKEIHDMDQVRRMLPEHADFYMIPDKTWHHMSYMFSIGGREACYNWLLEYMRTVKEGKPVPRSDL